MRRLWRVLPLVAACNGGGSGGSRTDTILSLSGDDAAGETIYADNCAICHAADGSGGSGPSLNGEELDAELVNVILNGEDSMPSFDELSDQEIADLIAWLDVNVLE
jgi:mono/diheme cytochrome c family protein